MCLPILSIRFPCAGTHKAPPYMAIWIFEHI